MYTTHLSIYSDHARGITGVFLGTYEGRDMRAETASEGCDLVPEQVLELIDRAIREWHENR
jgi:hypothetical protein